MDNYKIATQPGVIVVPANQISSLALNNWAQWCKETTQDDEKGEVVINQLFAPNGKTVAYLIDLRKVPERFESKLFMVVQQAKKAGEPPVGYEWLVENKPGMP